MTSLEFRKYALLKQNYRFIIFKADDINITSNSTAEIDILEKPAENIAALIAINCVDFNSISELIADRIVSIINISSDTFASIDKVMSNNFAATMQTITSPDIHSACLNNGFLSDFKAQFKIKGIDSLELLSNITVPELTSVGATTNAYLNTDNVSIKDDKVYNVSPLDIAITTSFAKFVASCDLNGVNIAADTTIDTDLLANTFEMLLAASVQNQSISVIFTDFCKIGICRLATLLDYADISLSSLNDLDLEWLKYYEIN